MNFEKPGGFRWLDSRVMGNIVQLATLMKKRQAASGPNPGKEFWGCTGYPACRGVRQVPTTPDGSRKETA